MYLKIVQFLLLCHVTLYSHEVALVVRVSNPETNVVMPQISKGHNQKIATTFYKHCLSILTEDLSGLEKDYSIFICTNSQDDIPWAKKNVA